MLHYLLRSPLDISPQDGLLYTHMVPYIGNLPGNNEVTLLHKAARDGDLEFFALYNKSPKEKSKNPILNRKAYFSEQTLRDCTSPSQITEVDNTPLQEFASPKRISQNYCNTRIRMADGSIRTFANTDAKTVHISLILREKEAMGDTQPIVLPNNTLTLYLNPRHAFIKLDCASCAEDGAAFHESRGFYPSGLSEDSSAVICSDIHNYLKTTFYISDQQARDAWLQQKAMGTDKTLKYKAQTMNCVDGAAMIVGAIGEERPYEFFTDEQLSPHFDFFSNGTFALPKLEDAAVWYSQFKHRSTPLVGVPIRAALDLAALYTYPNHQLDTSTYVTAISTTFLLAYMIYKITRCCFGKIKA